MQILSWKVTDFITGKGLLLEEVAMTYTDTAPQSDLPVVISVHALTGNSIVTGNDGWWKQLIGPGQAIDTDRYRIISFDIPGNGHGGDQNLLNDYQQFDPGDVASLFKLVIDGLGIEGIFAGIGGSLGGSILWEMAPLLGARLQYLIPIACDWESSDWLIGITHVQDDLLHSQDRPLEKAREMAMLFYRSSPSLTEKFHRSKVDHRDEYNVASWLHYHGEKLAGRFELQAYKTMNYLLGRIEFDRYDVDRSQTIQKIKAKVIQIGISSDLLFPVYRIQEIHEALLKHQKESTLMIIDSPHGHDAFLIEYAQMSRMLQPVFNELNEDYFLLKKQNQVPCES